MGRWWPAAAEQFGEHCVTSSQGRAHTISAGGVEKNRDVWRRVAGKGQLPNFVVGDFELSAGVRHSETTPKLAGTWAGPRWIVPAAKRYVYEGPEHVTGKVLEGARRPPFISYRQGSGNIC